MSAVSLILQFDKYVTTIEGLKVVGVFLSTASCLQTDNT